MLLPIELASLLLAAVIPYCHAQTFTKCNPLEKSCPDNTAIPANLKTSFVGASGPPAGWKVADETSGPITYGPGGVSFAVQKQGNNPTLQTVGTFLFGYAEVKMKSAPGQGILSSIVLWSDVQDEVDWEFIGGENYRVQANYYGKNVPDYTHMTYIDAPDNQNTYHTYALNWTSAALTWLVDGKAIRTLKYTDANGGKNYPQTPMYLKIGIWAGGDPTLPPGTIQWAGGLTDYSKGPYTMTVDSVNVVNYSPGKGYHYKDNSGSFDSIQVIDGTPGGIVAPGPSSPSSSMVMSPGMSMGSTATMPPKSSVVTTAVQTGASGASVNVKPANATTTGTGASIKANSTVSLSTPTAPASTSVKPAQANNASRLMATGSAMAGLAMLFLALMV